MNIVEKELDIVKKIIIESFENSILDEELKNFMLNGSKYIRSILAILFFKAQGVELNEKFYNILSTGEFIHNSSLLHDDVLDGADNRRGFTTIAKKYSDKISILAGDYLLSTAIATLLKVENLEILDLFRNCTKIMSETEIEQFLMRGNIPKKEDYIKICGGKTSELFATILESSAIILHKDRKFSRKFGEIFGICFQIKNDINKESALIDKKNEIYTALDIFGIEKTSHLLDNYKEELLKIISNFENNVYTELLKGLVKDL